MLYLFLGTQAHLLIAMWLLTAEFPVCATYELAPRVVRLSPLQDQQLAGPIMIGVAEPLILGIITVVFFRWYSEQEARSRADWASAAIPSELMFRAS
jgi:putative membrane protein